jgi:hypothetical protein
VACVFFSYGASSGFAIRVMLPRSLNELEIVLCSVFFLFIVFGGTGV